jgi:hypothetical protein
MSMNRVLNFIKRNVQNSNLNREKFVKNKMYYNNLKNFSKFKMINNSLIIKRYISTSSTYNNGGGEGGNNNGPGPNNYIIITIMAFGAYLTSGKFNEKK